ncbi:hypothetical protein niasHT_009501 [Heterodera trifolii]|uniref:BTB domain-containing protein n=1 Tax=Heterodera trifolii TaxID=157864 RepID=A0ABD2M7U4_9BILA
MFRYDVQNSKNSIGKGHATDKNPILVPDINIEAFKAMLTFIYTKHFNELNANNWLDVLKAADKYNIKGLVKKCADFPIEKLPNVFVAFEQARLRNLEVLHWADEQCRQNDIECSAENRRKMLDKVLPNIRFPLIPKEEFTKSVEVISVYQHYSHPNLSDVPGLIPLKFPTQQRYKSEGTIEMEIEKVSEFSLVEVYSRRFSDAVDIGGFSWKIKAQIVTKNENNEKWLGFFLCYDPKKVGALIRPMFVNAAHQQMPNPFCVDGTHTLQFLNGAIAQFGQHLPPICLLVVSINHRPEQMTPSGPLSVTNVVLRNGDGNRIEASGWQRYAGVLASLTVGDVYWFVNCSARARYQQLDCWYRISVDGRNAIVVPHTPNQFVPNVPPPSIVNDQVPTLQMGGGRVVDDPNAVPEDENNNTIDHRFGIPMRARPPQRRVAERVHRPLGDFFRIERTTPMRNTLRNTRGEVCELRFLPLEDAERPDLVLETLIQHLLDRVLEGHPRPMFVSLQLHPPGFDRPYVIPLRPLEQNNAAALAAAIERLNEQSAAGIDLLAGTTITKVLAVWPLESIRTDAQRGGACDLDGEHHVSHNVQSLVRVINPNDRHCLSRAVLLGLRDRETRMPNGGGRDAFTAYAQRQEQHGPEALTLLRRAGLPVNKNMYTLEDVEQLQQRINNEHGVGQIRLVDFEKEQEYRIVFKGEGDEQIVNSLAHQMKEVLDSGEYPDTVTAHRAILSSASDVFKTMFRYDVQNSKNSIGKGHATDKNPILVPDINIEAFKAMLTFIYTKHFNELNANNWLDVLKAADKYNIKGLVKKCADFPIEKLPNVFVAFEQARLRNLEALHWADEQCRQNDIECSAENRRKMLDKVLPNIRFPLIPKEEFTKSVEVISVYQHYSHPNLSDVPGLIPLKFPTQQRYKSEGTIEMEIEKVSEFSLVEVYSRRFSDAVDIGGFSWKIKAQIVTKNENNEKWLGFFLCYDPKKVGALIRPMFVNAAHQQMPNPFCVDGTHTLQFLNGAIAQFAQHLPPICLLVVSINHRPEQMTPSGPLSVTNVVLRNGDGNRIEASGWQRYAGVLASLTVGDVYWFVNCSARARYQQLDCWYRISVDGRNAIVVPHTPNQFVPNVPPPSIVNDQVPTLQMGGGRVVDDPNAVPEDENNNTIDHRFGIPMRARPPQRRVAERVHRPLGDFFRIERTTPMRNTLRNTRGEVCELRFLPLEDAERPDLVLETLIQHLLDRVLEGHPRPMFVSLQLHPPGFDRPYVIPLRPLEQNNAAALAAAIERLNEQSAAGIDLLAGTTITKVLAVWPLESIRTDAQRGGACDLDGEHHVSHNVQSLVRVINPNDRHCLSRAVLLGLRDRETRMPNGGGRDAFTAYAQRQEQHGPEALTLLRRAGLPVNKNMYTLEDVEQLQQRISNEHGVGQIRLVVFEKEQEYRIVFKGEG